MFSLSLAGVLAAGVLAGVAFPAYGDEYGITTQNVRVTMDAAHARHDIRQAAARGSVLFTQEMGRRNARRFRPAGWSSTHAAGTYRGDCATFWDRDRWRLRRAYAVRIVDAETRRPSNGHRFALVAVLTGAETLAAVCVHMPTHGASRGIYAAGARRLRALLARLSSRYARVAVGGDWNRHYVNRVRFPGFRAARPPAATGSGGGRIDYVYVRRPAHITRVRVIGHTYSDHNGVRVWVRNG